MQVLENHFVAGELSSAAIIDAVGASGGSIIVQTLFGSELFVTTQGASLLVQSRGIAAPGATVVVPDVATCAGVVHVIDELLVAAGPGGATFAFGG